MDCGVFYKFNDKCSFEQEINENDLKSLFGYNEVHFKNGKLNHVIRIDKLIGGTPTVAEKLKFDSKGRISQHETFSRSPSLRKYWNCKYSYGKQLIESWCYDKNGRFVRRDLKEEGSKEGSSPLLTIAPSTDARFIKCIRRYHPSVRHRELLEGAWRSSFKNFWF